MDDPKNQPSLSKAEAQSRVDQIGAFQLELELLERNGIVDLSQEQAASIYHYHQQLMSQLRSDHDVDTSQSSKSLTRGMQVASFLGALTMAASVFFLFYQYWGFIGLAGRVVILLAAPLLTLLATAWIRQKESTGYFAKLMALISFACFVLNISMFGQMFNLPPSDTALLVWALYAGFLAYAFDIRLLLAFAILFFYGFVAARVGAWGGLYWLSMGERPENFILPALILFWVPSWLRHRAYHDFDTIYRVFAVIGFMLAVLVLSHWGYASYLESVLGVDADVVEGLYQLLGFVLSAGFIYLGIKKQWPAVVNTANTFFVIFLYTKFFEWWWELMPKWLFFFLLGLTAILFLMVFKRLRGSLNELIVPQKNVTKTTQQEAPNETA